MLNRQAVTNLICVKFCRPEDRQKGQKVLTLNRRKEETGSA